MKNYLLFLCLFFFCGGVFAQTYNWAKLIEGPNYNRNEHATTATDGSGNIIVAGSYAGDISVDFGSTIDTAVATEDMYLAKYDGSGNFLWKYTPKGSSGYNRVVEVACDAAGNVYAIGYFGNTINFGNGDVTSAGGRDVFVLKLNASGGLEWVVTGQGADSDEGTGIGVDNSGNVFAFGDFKSDTISFGTQDILKTTAIWSKSLFVVKLDNSGNVQWTQSGRDASCRGYELAVDPSGNPVMTGWFSGSLVFDSDTVTSQGNSDVFVVKLDGSNGSSTWLTQAGSPVAGGTAFETGRTVTTDMNGNVIVSGEYTGNLVVQGDTLPYTGGNKYDIFIIKLDAMGTYQWYQVIASVADDYGRGLATDGSGNIYFAGETRDSSIINGNKFFEGFVLKYDASGNYQMGVSASKKATDCALFPDGTLAVVGEYEDSLSSIVIAGNYGASGTYFTRLDLGGTPMAAGDDFRVNASPVIYPVPSHGTFHVDMPQAGDAAVYDIHGREILQVALKAGQNDLQIEEKGLFFIRIHMDGTQITKRIVIR